VIQKEKKSIYALFIFFLVLGCASVKPKIPVDQGSAEPGGTVARGEMRLKLLGTPLAVGDPLPSVKLVDAATLKDVDLSQERGKVLFLSIVPSVDTRVCEEQTHSLGEEGKKLPGDIRLITISRDTPFAQKRFAKEAKLTHLQYLSDYRQGDFGRSTGLLVEGSMLLSRSIVLVDRSGIVRYIQVVPDITHLPDMERAFREAVELARKGN
jgi:thioredoxin-dependent peroxiredoxin